MLESQVQSIETEAVKLLAQLNNQGLAAQFAGALANLQTAIATLRNAVAAMEAIVPATPPPPATPKAPEPPPMPSVKGTPKMAVPPDAQFFQEVKPAPSNE